MSSLARENVPNAWTDKMQALPTLLQNPWCCASLVAFAAVASFLSTGLLWPAAAILSSILTAFVQGCLEKRNQQQRPQAAHAESLKGPQLETCDENAHGNANGESSIVTALAAEIVTCASRTEDFVENVKQSSISFCEPFVVTSLDHVSISLKRSEGEDWGFAWQVGAYGAKRLILVNIGAASPMDSCNAFREAHGQEMIAPGDELVSVDTHTEFGAMQKVLDSATYLELTFLKAHVVKPVLLSAARRPKRRLSNTIMRELKLLPFDTVVTTKNTFVDFRRAESDHMERFAHSDPTPLSCMSPTFSSNDDQSDEAETMSASLSSAFDDNDSFSESYTHFDTMDVREVIDLCDLWGKGNSCNDMAKADPPFSSEMHCVEGLETNSSCNVDTVGLQQQTAFPEIVPQELETPHFDTIELHDFKEETHLFEDRPLLSEVQCSSMQYSDSIELLHIVEPMQDNAKKTPIHLDMCHVETIDPQQQTSFPETLHFDTMYLHVFKEETHPFGDMPLLSEVQFADKSTPHSDSIELLDTVESLQDKAKKNPIHLADLLMEPGQVETSFLPATHSSSLEQARSLEFHSAPASCYAKNLANDVQQRFLLPSSQCLGTQPCFTPCWGEPANIFSLMRHDKQLNRNSPAYQHESPLQNHCDENAWKIASCKEPSFLSPETKRKRKTQQKQKSLGAVIPQVSEDWYCPKCFDLQFRANLKCRMCGLPREHGVTQLEQLDADRFLEGHNVTAYVAARFRSLAPNLQQIVMSGGSLHGARDPTAVLSNRIRRAEALASTTSSRESSSIKLGFDRKQKPSQRHFPAGGDPSD